MSAPPRASRPQPLAPLGGPAGDVVREIAIETAVALEFNGIAYAVMMATPADLEDFITGFAIAERLIGPGDTLGEIAVSVVEAGVIVRANLPATGAARVMERARTRVAESSCGLCGIENLAALARPLPAVAAPLVLSAEAVAAALAALPHHQALGRATSATHAAALVRTDGTIVLAREDVGRHNALDKAVGARARQGLAGAHFALSTARCSYELVEKAVVAGLGALVTISAPTSLAIDRAGAANLPLYVLARPDGVMQVAHQSIPRSVERG
ncbi:MAG: formate dehydrogenase accessory sulfurtransferase FdhD [Acuticoccus sp.]